MFSIFIVIEIYRVLVTKRSIDVRVRAALVKLFDLNKFEIHFVSFPTRVHQPHPSDQKYGQLGKVSFPIKKKVFTLTFWAISR